MIHALITMVPGSYPGPLLSEFLYIHTLKSSGKPPFKTGKNFDEEYSILTFRG